MAYLDEIREAQRARGPATILAIGTATPSNCIYQSDFPDYYFRVTNSNHMPQLKDKLKRICKFVYTCMHALIHAYMFVFVVIHEYYVYIW